MKWNAEIMDALIEPIEKLGSLYNASYEQFPIDLAELQESVQPDVEHLVEKIVGSAKATAVDRKSVVEGKRGDLGGRRIIKKKKKEKTRRGQNEERKQEQSNRGKSNGYKSDEKMRRPLR